MEALRSGSANFLFMYETLFHTSPNLEVYSVSFNLLEVLSLMSNFFHFTLLSARSQLSNTILPSHAIRCIVILVGSISQISSWLFLQYNSLFMSRAGKGRVIPHVIHLMRRLGICYTFCLKLVQLCLSLPSKKMFGELSGRTCLATIKFHRRFSRN